MAQTQTYKKSLSGSIGAGMKSLVGSEGRRYYVLEHKVSSRYHKAGEAQRIIVDQIELGRDSQCQVRFDESFQTVSRRHAAIVKDGDNWKLVQLSQTNSTYLNGRKVEKEWYLQSGDEIQLSTNGPKLGFIVPQGDKSLVKSIGLTARMNLFRQQALRPYKTAISAMAAVLVLMVAGFSGWNYQLQQKYKEQSRVLAQAINALKDNQKRADSLAIELKENNKKIAGYEKAIEKFKKTADRVKDLDVIVTGGDGSEQNDVYFCMYALELDGKIISGSSGTAFLLNDGRLVTAQHVVNPFMSVPETEKQAWLLGWLDQAPEHFTCHFLAVSPKGDKIQYDYPFTKNQFHTGRYSKEIIGTVTNGDIELPVYCITEVDDRDYAWVQTNKKGRLVADAVYSQTLRAKTHLDIYGFPQGVGAEDINKVSPIYSESYVAREGLDVDGCILLSNSETDHGNSGGPVMTVKDGKPVVVGILSGSNLLGSKTIDWDAVAKMSEEDRNAYLESVKSAKSKDRVVPISAIYK